MVAVATTTIDESTTSELQELRRELEQRLTLGWRWIDEATAAGRDVRTAERRWIILLSEYEQVCAMLTQRAA